MSGSAVDGTDTVEHRTRSVGGLPRLLMGTISTALFVIVSGAPARAAAPDRLPPSSAMERDSLETLIRAQVDLGFRVLGAQTRRGDGNALVAPPALATILVVLHAGADGEAQEELAGVLGLAGSADGDPAPDWSDVLDAMRAPGDPERVALEEAMLARTPRIISAGTPEIFVGASLWIDASRTPDRELQTRLRESLEATVESVELDAPSGRRRIDAWIRKWSLETLDGLARPLPDDLGALALGSLFFHAGWESPFSEEATIGHDFSLPDGTTREYPFLRQTETWSYRRGPDAAVVRLPYVGDRYALYAVLPEEDGGVVEVVQELDFRTWSRWIDEMRPRRGTVQLPRIRIRAGAELDEALRHLGLDTALDPARRPYPGFVADGRSMGVGRILQDVLLEVDEEGTRAVGVVRAELEEELQDAEEPFEFVADRPFLVVLRDDESGAVLMAIVVRNPAPDGYSDQEVE